MTGEASTDANLRDYEEELNKLDSDDIRVPNQSLVLDYFCTDDELTDFLRREVFSESSRRHGSWKIINQRAGKNSTRMVEDEISFLLNYGNSLSAKVWEEIVRLTARKQAHQELVEYINRSIYYGQSVSTDFEQRSRSPVREPESEVSAASRENINNNQSAHMASNADRYSQLQQTNKNPASTQNTDKRLPILIASLGLLGLLGIVTSMPSYETSNTSLEETSSSQPATDASEVVSRLSNLEVEQKDALLMCEHQPILGKANSLSLVESQNINRRDSLIASSNKQINFLDQKSAKGYKYWEDPSCMWGEQWFDNDADGNFRLFLVVSKKCSNPIVNYKYTKDQEGKNLVSRGKYSAYGHTMGEIRIPYPPEYGYVSIENVTCS